MFLARGDGIEGRPDGGAVGGVLVARRDVGADGLVIEGRLEGRGCGCLVRTVHAFVKKH